MFVVEGGWVKTKKKARLRSISDVPYPHLIWTCPVPGPGPELDNLGFLMASILIYALEILCYSGNILSGNLGS